MKRSYWVLVKDVDFFMEVSVSNITENMQKAFTENLILYLISQHCLLEVKNKITKHSSHLTTNKI